MESHGRKTQRDELACTQSTISLKFIQIARNRLNKNWCKEIGVGVNISLIRAGVIGCLVLLGVCGLLLMA
jgi:hypothetical protein